MKLRAQRLNWIRNYGEKKGDNREIVKEVLGIVVTRQSPVTGTRKTLRKSVNEDIRLGIWAESTLRKEEIGHESENHDDLRKT